MSVLFPETVLSTKRKRVIIRELLQGKEYATQLKFLLQNPIIGSSSPSAKELVTNVLRSFADTLSVMTSSSEAGSCGCDEVTDRSLVNSGEDYGSQVGSDLRSEDSSESRKRLLPPAAAKDRRGSYKRRKTEQTHTVVSQTTDDDHAWRKYGQKEILNSQFPRSYFRCTRRYDQGCRATKQVQRIKENPDMYQITYIGFHTCKATLEAPQMLTFSDTNWNSFLVNSQPAEADSKVPNDQHDPPICSQRPTVKQEYPCDDSTPSDLTDDLDPNLWSDLKDFEISKPVNTVYSCTESQHLEIDFGIFSSDFDFHFDETRLLQ